MSIIFLFSSRSADELPNYGVLDYLVKKFAHAVGYGALALSYLHAFTKKNYFLAWLFTLLYAATDEFHQSFVTGRNSSLVDIFVFDNIGAVVALFFHRRWASQCD